MLASRVSVAVMNQSLLPPCGLVIVRGFVNPEEEARLVRELDERKWDHTQEQHYTAPDIPPFLQALATRLHECGLVRQEFDRVIVNYYLPGQGMVPRIVSPHRFREEVVMVSLQAQVPMKFTQDTEPAPVTVHMERRTACLLTDEARYKWRHGVEAQRFDVEPVNHTQTARGRRLTVTFCTTREDFVPGPHQ
jgi:alkylated DNA repair dioxygenase AlkB